MTYKGEAELEQLLEAAVKYARAGENMLELSDREAFLVNLLVKGFLGETMYEPKHTRVVEEAMRRLRDATDEAAERHEQSTGFGQKQSR